MQSVVMVQQSLRLEGKVQISGAKNAVLVSMASLLLVSGKSILRNVPDLEDVYCMGQMLTSLGAHVYFDAENNYLEVDTTHVHGTSVSAEMMQKIRASILVLGPLLGRFKKATLAFPGGDAIGRRPIDFHLSNFEKMGAQIVSEGNTICATAQTLYVGKFIFDYPSVGATENILMAALCVQGTSYIINASLEPEVLDLISLLQKMGADIAIQAPAMIVIHGGKPLHPVDHTVMFDRLEAGTYLLAAAITGGSIEIPNADASIKDIFISKLESMGHTITTSQGAGIYLKANSKMCAVSIRTEPYPGFPTDLQPLMMAVQTLACGQSVVHETVYDNRFLHVPELIKMGALIEIKGNKSYIQGVETLQGTDVCGQDIRGAMCLVLAGLAAQGETIVQGAHHIKRGYEDFEEKMRSLGANISLKTT